MNKRVLTSILAVAAGFCCTVLLNGTVAGAAVAPVVSGYSAIVEGSVTPVRVAADTQGNFYSTDPRGGGVLKYNSAGTLLQRIVTTGKNLLGVAVAQNGEVLVSQGTAVAVYSSSGVFKMYFGNFGVANGIAIDDTGTVYVVDSKNSKVQAFSGTDYTPTGVAFGSQGSVAGQFRQPTGIAFEKISKQLAVVDTLNGRVQFFDTAGNYKKSVGSFGSGPLKFTSPQGIAFEYSTDGTTLTRIYVVDSFQANVQVIDAASSAFLRYIGSYGFRSGQLLTPGDVLLDSFRRLVIPNGTGSLAVFAIEGAGGAATGTPAVSFPSASGAAPPVLTLVPPAALSTLSTVTVSGTVAAGSAVTVNGVSASVTGTSWTAPVTLTQQGLNNIVVTAVGAGGTSSISSYITLDSVAPVLQTIVIPKQGSTTGVPIQTIVGTVSDSTAVTVTVTVAGVPQPPVTVNDGVFAATVTLASGNNIIEVKAKDAGGKETTSSSTVIYSPLAPVVTVATPAGAVSNSTGYTVSGAVQPGSTVSVNGVPAVLSGQNNTTWTATIPLSTGINPITVTATATATGSTSTATSSVVYAADQPALALTSPAMDSATAGKTATISGTTDKGASVTTTLDGGKAIPVTVAADGSFSIPVTLGSSGLHTVTVTSVGTSGTVSTTSRSLVYDPSPPVFSVLDATAGSIKISSGNGVVVARDKNGVIATASGNGTPSLDLSAAVYDADTLNIEILTSTGLSSRSGNVNASSDGAVTIADALLAAQMSLGLLTPTFEQRMRGDVGPLVNHVSVPDGKIGLDDVMLILQKSIGLDW